MSIPSMQVMDMRSKLSDNVQLSLKNSSFTSMPVSLASALHKGNNLPL